MSADEYDLVVLGGGSAGLTAALVGLGLGARVALVERGRLGGECTWRGCVPSKSLLAAARAYSTPAGFCRFGLTLDAPPRIDTSGVMRHVRSISAGVGKDESADVLAGYGIDVLPAEARFLGPDEVEVQGRRLRARRFVVATGSRSIMPAVPGLDETTALTSDTLWDIDTVPESLVILGGGPVAVEMASAFTRLGCRVTLLARSNLLREEEPELVERLSAILASQGVEIVLQASLTRVGRDSGGGSS